MLDYLFNVFLILAGVLAATVVVALVAEVIHYFRADKLPIQDEDPEWWNYK